MTREFCGECGTHLTTRRPGLPLVILKVGTLDDPSLFGAPQMAIYAVDEQPFHVTPDGLHTFEHYPHASGLLRNCLVGPGGLEPPTRPL